MPGPYIGTRSAIVPRTKNVNMYIAKFIRIRYNKNW